MIGSAKPLAWAPLQARPPSTAGRRLAPSFCAPDTAPALQSQSDDGAPPPRPDETATSPALLRSSQLSRWSRSRGLRSGRRVGLDRAALSSASAPPVTKPSRPEDAAVAVEDGEDDDDDVCEAERDDAAGKAIYIVSDGTGWTAEHSVNAALGQFENCIADRGCAVNTHLIPLVNISPCLHILFIYFLLEVRSWCAKLLTERVVIMEDVLFCHLTIELAN